MKSEMLNNTVTKENGEVVPLIPENEKEGYTDLQVLQSGAGWYIGTLYNNPLGFVEHGSRDSGYFATKEEAAAALKFIEDENATYMLRRNP